MSTRLIVALNLILSAVLVGILTWLIYAFQLFEDGESATRLPWLPTFNAACNGTAATLLLAGYIAIRRQAKALHIGFMIAATTASALFLVGYLVHHSLHGDTRFLTEGWLRPLYFLILISHIVLATICLPLVLITLSFAGLGRYQAHRAIARWTFPIWIYVSITGVIVYFFLRHLNTSSPS